MANFCGMCGSRLDAHTGKCPKCDKKKNPDKKKNGKRITIILLSALCVCVIAVGAVFACSFFKKDANKDTNTSTDTSTKNYYQPYNYFTEGFSPVSVLDFDSALQAVESVAEQLGITDVKSELKAGSVQKVENESFYKISQYYRDIPVYSRNIVIAVDKDVKTLALTSNYTPVSHDIDTEPKADKKKAAKAVAEYLGRDVSEISDLGKFELIIYTLGGKEELAYSVTLGSVGTAFVNANTAEIIGFNSSVNSVAAEVQSKDGKLKTTAWKNDDGTFCLYNEEYGIKIFDVKGINTLIDDKGSVHSDFYDYNINEIRSKKNKFSNNTISLMNDVIKLADYFEELGFEGFSQIHVAINDSFDKGKNARGGSAIEDGKNCGVMLFGSEYKFDTTDITTHEFTHAVDQIIVKWTNTNAENKGLQEAYSDMFGILYENSQKPDWEIAGRDIINPSKSGCCTTYSDVENSDNPEEHSISTVISHTAYLMWNGIDGTADRKIDGDTLVKLWYKSLLLLPSDSNYSHCRNAVELAARIMQKNGELTKTQCETVKSAFEATGVTKPIITVSTKVRDKFELTVKSLLQSGNVTYNLEVIKMQNIASEDENVQPQHITVMTKNDVSQPLTLELENGEYYLLGISDANTKNSNSQKFWALVQVDSDDEKATDKLVVNVDFVEYTEMSSEKAIDIYLANKNVWLQKTYLFDGDEFNVKGVLSERNYKINEANSGSVYILTVSPKVLEVRYKDYSKDYYIKEIQCNFTSAEQAKDYIGKEITVKGKLMEASTGHHLTELVLIDCVMTNSEYGISSENVYGYTLVDLDFDGTLELIRSLSEGTGGYSNNTFFKIDEATETVQEIPTVQSYSEQGFDYYTLCDRTKLLKSPDGELFYYCADFLNGSPRGESMRNYGKAYMDSGKLRQELLFYEYECEAGILGNDEYVKRFACYKNATQNFVEEDEYNSEMSLFFDENTDMHLTQKSISGGKFELLSESEQQKVFTEAYFAFAYDGFSLDGKTGSDISEKESEPEDTVTESEPEPTQNVYIDDSTAVFEYTTGMGRVTTVTVPADGRFKGISEELVYETGEDYPDGTVYICEFSGNFTDGVRLNENVYSMTVCFLTFEHEVGETYIENGKRYVCVEPYGIEEGITYYLYMPGADIPSEDAEALEYTDMYFTQNTTVPDDCYVLSSEKFTPFIAYSDR